MTAEIKKILVVDDDPQVHKMLSTVLTVKNCQVDYAPDGFSALNQIELNSPDLVVLDIMMPEMSGIELCRKIRENTKNKKVLILMLSAKDSQSDRITGLQYGADDYVTKPFHVSTLVHKIEYMLNKTEK